jgi:hypothetical protein
MIHIGLFEGIGGFTIAAKWMGWKTYAMCEINLFGQRVLKYHFPDAYLHSDIKTLTYETINFELTKRFGRQWRNDDIILTGGFPCQPYSVAGKRNGNADDRHLWPEMLNCTFKKGEKTYRIIGSSYLIDLFLMKKSRRWRRRSILCLIQIILIQQMIDVAIKEKAIFKAQKI